MYRKKECVAMLLAGGRGSRLYVLTKKVAKPAVPFGGKYRIIDFPLSNCVNSGIDTVGVLTQYERMCSTLTSVPARRGTSTACAAASMFCRRTRAKRPSGTRAPQTPSTRTFSSWRITIRVRPHSLGRPHLQDGLQQDAPAAQGDRR